MDEKEKNKNFCLKGGAYMHLEWNQRDSSGQQVGEGIVALLRPLQDRYLQI
jgi:hypothetical protein